MTGDIYRHESWHTLARDADGHDMDLRLAIEQTGHRGYSAHAYWDRGPDNREEMIVTTVSAGSGPEAFRSLRNKLEHERGLTLDAHDPPDWLMAPEWQEITGRPKPADEDE